METITWQNWDNLIDYIKTELGWPVIQIELSDEDILNQIKRHILPFFSRYSPLLRYYLLTEESNCIQYEPTKIYKIKNFPYKIIKIDEIIAKPNLLDYNQNISTALYSGDITNLLGSNYVLQSKTTVLADDTYEFISPNKIEMIKSSNSVWIYDDFIAKLACVHDNVSTVDPDMYVYLRDLALAEVMIRLGKIRSKFENFATPVGQIQINSQQLQQEGEQLKRDVIEKLDRMPPDHYLYFLN